MSDLGRAQRSILHTENLWAILQKSANELQTVPGVVQFVGGGRRAQNKRIIPLESGHLGDSRNVTFLKIYRHFFGKFWFDKIRHIFALLALPAMVRERYGQIAYIKRILTSCTVTLAWLRSRASPQFFDDEASRFVGRS